MIYSKRKRRRNWTDLLDFRDNCSPYFVDYSPDLLGLTLGMSSLGYWAMFPVTARLGDLICVVRGLSVPVILRPMESKFGVVDEGDLYTFVGPAHVQGLVDGEVARAIKAGAMVERSIQIA